MLYNNSYCNQSPNWVILNDVTSWITTLFRQAMDLRPRWSVVHFLVPYIMYIFNDIFQGCIEVLQSGEPDELIYYTS